MTIRRNVTVLLLICLGYFLVMYTVLADSHEPTEPVERIESLQEGIEENNRELQELQQEREALEEKLEAVEGKSNELSSELRRINYQVEQLNISTRANRLTIKKFGYEVASLHEDIFDTEKKIEQSKETIGKLFVQLQQRENENFLVIFLKYKSLAESISEMQSIMTLGNTLTNNVTQMRGLQTKLARKAKEVENKKYGIEIEQRTLVNRQGIINDRKSEKKYLLAQTKNEGKVYQEKIAELEKRQEEISAVITEIEDQLRRSFDPTLLPRPRPGVLAYPVQGTPLITQCYGETKFARKAYRTNMHGGLDLRAPLGAPILAVADGVVRAVDNNDRGSARWSRYQYGKYIVIDHNNSLSSLYAHLSKQVVQKGDTVKVGDLIGYSGNTGYSFGAHLHLGLYWTPSIQYRKVPDPATAIHAGLVPVGVTIDPLDYLRIIGNAKNCL